MLGGVAGRCAHPNISGPVSPQPNPRPLIRRQLRMTRTSWSCLYDNFFDFLREARVSFVIPELHLLVVVQTN